MDIFEVEEERFNSSRHFHQYLSQNYDEISEDNLYICSGITEFTSKEFIEAIKQEGWEIADSYGAIELIRSEYQSGYVEAYLSFDEDTGLLFLYTDQRKSEEIDNAILPLLQKTKGLHYLYIGPRIIRDLCEEIAEEWESSKVTTFIAKRTSGTEIGAKRRPNTRRTINYYGEDGLRALREVERDYGVLPHTVEVHIPSKLRFRVNKEGVFTLKWGELNTLFEYMNTCIRQTLAMKREYDETDFDVLEVRGGEYEIPESKPATIRLTNRLSVSDIKQIRDRIRDSDYTLLDVFIDESTPTLSAKVFDKEENLFFNIELRSDEMLIYPREKSRMGIFLRFFEFIQSEIDDRATPKSDENMPILGEKD